MSREKKWQCPHCTQDSTRRWNVADHIRTVHEGIGDPVEKGNMSQHANSSPSAHGRLTHSGKPPSSYNRSKHVYTNHANNGSKAHEDTIDKWYQRVIELEEKERKIRKIKEFCCRNPDAPVLIPSIDTSILPTKNMLEQCLQKISFQSGASNNNNNNPSPKMQDNDDDRNKIASQETAGNDPKAAFPRGNRHSYPRSIQPVLINHDDNDRNKIADQKPAIQGIKNRQDLNGQAKQPLARTGLTRRLEENRDRKDSLKNGYWVVKRNIMGDWMDCYRVEPELNWKKGG